MFPIDVNSLKGVTQNSSSVEEGYLFAALKGVKLDGNDFIDDALSRGASVILSDNKKHDDKRDKRVITVENAREQFSHIVAEFYKKQPQNIIAVTGTNGKSSVVHFIDQILKKTSRKSAYIGTLSGNMTTPDPVSLHEKLAKMADNGVEYVAIEASSHGLEQYRIDGARVNVAAFTNLTQDHLDYHHNMEEYFTAKKRLFSEILNENGTAVLNADIAQYHELKELCENRGIKVISYGEKGKEIKLESCKISGLGQNIKIKFYGVNYDVVIPLIGHFQIMNILCALGCCVAGESKGLDTNFDSLTEEKLEASDGEPHGSAKPKWRLNEVAHSKNEQRYEQYLAAIQELEPAQGRLQKVSSDCGKYNAYIDYAHSPDALANVLETLRDYTNGNLICVFGCGGDRDKTKRSLMGGVAEKYADILIVTDDNPRSENPASIRSDILSGINSKNIHEIPDRRQAINFAVEQMQTEDILLVAGKGHEQGQIFSDHTEKFDDVTEVNTAFKAKLSRVKGNI